MSIREVVNHGCEVFHQKINIVHFSSCLLSKQQPTTPFVESTFDLVAPSISLCDYEYQRSFFQNMIVTFFIKKWLSSIFHLFNIPNNNQLYILFIWQSFFFDHYSKTFIDLVEGTPDPRPRDAFPTLTWLRKIFSNYSTTNQNFLCGYIVHQKSFSTKKNCQKRMKIDRVLTCAMQTRRGVKVLMPQQREVKKLFHFSFQYNF